ncbi:MAG: hypothetical protein ACKV2O_18960 [Acidimicrobiales bacterium]
MTDITKPPPPKPTEPAEPTTPTIPPNPPKTRFDQDFYVKTARRIDVDSILRANNPPPTAPRRSLSVLVGLTLGAGGGLLLGVAMRGFMRLVSDDPEFSWSGTIFVVMVFVIFGATQGLAGGGRRARLRRRWLTPLRLLGGLGMLVTMGAAGAIMAPTTLAGGLARHRHDWPRWARAALVLVAAANVTVVSVTTLSGQAAHIAPWLGVLLMVCCYGVVVQAAGQTLAPQQDGWRLPRWAKIMVAVSLVVPALAVTVSVTGIQG